MATPHVAGLASLAWSARPNLSYAQIKNVILNSGDAIGSLAGKTVSGKRINAQNVLLALGYTQPYT
ncbi:MAG: S8 family serine peptidase [bacterium]